MKDYIEIQLKELFDEKSEYFSKIMDILKNPNPENRDYIEVHHIIPKSLNKSLKDDKNNMIALSSYNHTMIHYYYYKCTRTAELKIKTRPMFTIITKKCRKVRKFDSWTDKEAEDIAKAIQDVRENLITLTRPFICLETNKVYKSRELCVYELDAKNVNKVLLNKTSHCKGYHFIYCDDERLKTMSNEEIINDIKQAAKRKSDLSKAKRKDLFTDEWRNKLSKAHNGKKFVCLETNEVFTNQAECCDRFNILRSELCTMLNKDEFHKTNKYHFIYVEKKGSRTNEECLRNIQDYILKYDGNLNRYNAKKVICYETGVVYNSTSEATRKTKITGIARCCLHISTCAGGFHWFFLDEDIDRELYVKNHPVKYVNNRVICLETKEMFATVKDVSNKLNCSRGLVTAACNGKIQTCKGYHFLYVRDYFTKSEEEIKQILLKKNNDVMNKKKELYRKLVKEGKWSPENDGWNRFQQHYKDFVNLEVA